MLCSLIPPVNQSIDTEIYLIRSLWMCSHSAIRIFTKTSLLYLAFQCLCRDQQWPVHLFLKGLRLYCSCWASRSSIVFILPVEIRIIALWSGIQEVGTAPELTHVAQRACLFDISQWRAVSLGTPCANIIIDGIMSPRFTKQQLFSDIQVRSSTYCA